MDNIWESSYHDDDQALLIVSMSDLGWAIEKICVNTFGKGQLTEFSPLNL